jgi:hypothetical protein
MSISSSTNSNDTRARRSPLSFSMNELRTLQYELDHPVDAQSHSANLSIRHDYLVEKRRRLVQSVRIVDPHASQDDETFRHTRLARDIRDADAALRTVQKAMSQLRVGGHLPFMG